MLLNLTYRLWEWTLISCFTLSFGSSFNSTLQDKSFYSLQLTDSFDSELIYIGEIKGKTYIKLDLNPIQISSVYSREDFGILRYKGSYYESVSDKKYLLTGDFDPELRTWTFRCFNHNNQPIFFFSGKQKPDGSITGIWRSKRNSYPFYLKPS